jgi:RHS repeat-associated protein
LSYSDTDGDGQIAAATEILEENNYYALGIKHGRYNGNNNSTNLGQDYKLNGKEYEDALGLNLYEMDMRSYDPTIGRWSSIDPVTHHSMSTYTAFDNNPIFWADPSGADAIKPKFEIELSTDVKNGSNALTSTVVDESGKIIDYKDDGDSYIYLNERGGVVIGEEQDGKDYVVGDNLVAGDLNELGVLWFLDGLDVTFVEETTDEERNVQIMNFLLSWVDLGNEEIGPTAPPVLTYHKLPGESIIDVDTDFGVRKKKSSTKTNRKINTKRYDKWKKTEAELRKKLSEAKTKAEKRQINKQIKHAQNQQKKSEPHGVRGQRGN